MQHIDGPKVSEQLVTFLKNAFTQAGFHQAVIGLSGGIDSATSCALAVRALGADQVFPLLLPYKKLNQPGVTDARLVVQALGIPARNVSIVDITSIADAAMALDPSLDQIRRGNIMARSRMIVLFDAAKKHKALVVGTENKTEHLLGYFTRFGDEASDVEPLRHLYKTQVYELARFLQVPAPLLTKPPTAGLWDGQTDEGEFGFTYKDADEILTRYIDDERPVDTIVADGFDRAVVQKVIALADYNAFKHHLPYIPVA